MYGKTKDRQEARQDQQRMKEANIMHREKNEKDKRPASYDITKTEKEVFFECLSSIKVPSGFSRSEERRVGKECRL